MKFEAAVWREGDVFVSQCLDVDVASYGDTVEDALESLKEAVECHLSGVSNVGEMLKNRPDLSFPAESVRREISFIRQSGLSGSRFTKS